MKINYEALYRGPDLDLSSFDIKPVVVRAPVAMFKPKAGCCERAVRIVCVCEEAWLCPSHGEKHIGSHD